MENLNAKDRYLIEDALIAKLAYRAEIIGKHNKIEDQPIYKLLEKMGVKDINEKLEIENDPFAGING